MDLGANDTMRVTNLENLKLLKVRSRVWNLSERLQTADDRAFDTILAGDMISDERPRTLLLDTLDVNAMEVQRHQSSRQLGSEHHPFMLFDSNT